MVPRRKTSKDLLSYAKYLFIEAKSVDGRARFSPRPREFEFVVNLKTAKAQPLGAAEQMFGAG